MGKAATITVASLAVGVVVGVVFRLLYPLVAVTPQLAALFALAGLLVVLAARGVWRLYRPAAKEGGADG